jgi:hypothetical protein
LFLVFCGVQVIAPKHGYKGQNGLKEMIVEFLPVHSIALGAIERNCGQTQEAGLNAGLVNPRLTRLP